MWRTHWQKLSHWLDIAMFLRFVAVGLTSAAVNFGSFALFWHLFSWQYQVAVSIAYVLSVITHFFGNRHLTFRGRGQCIKSHVGKYIVMLGLNYLITLAVVTLVVSKLHFSPYIGMVGAIACTVFVSYFLSKNWVFKPINIAG